MVTLNVGWGIPNYRTRRTRCGERGAPPRGGASSMSQTWCIGLGIEKTRLVCFVRISTQYFMVPQNEPCPTSPTGQGRVQWGHTTICSPHLGGGAQPAQIFRAKGPQKMNQKIFSYIKKPKAPGTQAHREVQTHFFPASQPRFL